MATSQPLVISLPNIPQGWYMTWTMSTQAANNVCATLKDSATTYVNNVCRQNQSFGILAQGFQQVAGSNLQLSVTATSSSGTPNLIAATNAFALTNPLGKNVAFGYNIAVEDSTDQDFNDLYVSVVAWTTAN